MSYRSNKGRNNVTYLHKNKKNNLRASKNKKVNKKRKINKAKLSILVLGILFFIFACKYIGGRYYGKTGLSCAHDSRNYFCDR